MEVWGLSRIVIRRAKAQLILTKNNGTSLTFPVGVGRPDSPTLLGNFKIIGKEIGTKRSTGTRTIYVSMPGKICGIFGTAQARAVGRATTSGCIAMLNKDIEVIYDLVEVGETVEIVP
jgi:lipoprotein-anchoring transpeptidase ErfK/SrfK